jgi:putative oxidoreductase
MVASTRPMRRDALTRLEPAALLLGRVLLATIFIHEGMAKLGNYAGSAAYAKAFGVPEALLPFAIATELGCGALVALGLYVRPAAVMLAGFCAVTALIFHAKFSELNQLLHFEKNLAMAGGLLALAVAGPGLMALETFLTHSEAQPTQSTDDRQR